IADDGLVVWPQRDYRTELVYPIRDGSGRVLEPIIRGDAPTLPPPVLDTRRMAFSDQAISWLAWVAAWTAAERDDARIPRLLRGVSILPSDDGEPPKVREETPRFISVPKTVHAAPIVAV